MTDLRQAAQMALTWFEWFHKGNSIESPVSSIQCSNSLRAALMSVPDGAEQSAKHGEPVRTEFTRVINHAIEQGTEAWVFLRCWQEGDWSGCAEFGFEPNMAAYTAPQPTKQPLTDEELRDALRSCPHDTVENLRVRWLYAKDFARAIERAHGINVHWHGESRND